MLQRGVSEEEIATTVAQGWEASDCKPGTLGRVFVFQKHGTRGGKPFEEKEVTVYYKAIGDEIVPLTVIARYGSGFLKEGGSKNEI